MLQITLTDNLKFETIPEVLNQGLWVLFKDLWICVEKTLYFYV